MPAATTINRYSPTVITKGIKYIKINRFDEQGTDNTISLQELTNLRLLFEDLGIVDFPVLSISEYPDYYLYRVGPVVLGESTSKFKSPTDPNTATNTYTLTSGLNTSPIFYGYTDTTGSINSNGLYDFPNGGYTVTATCYFSASATVAAKEDFYILFTGSNGIISKQKFSPYLGSPGVGSYSASISYVPTSGSTLGIAFASSSVNVSFNLPSIDFRITQDITSSINNNILDHTFSASAFTTSSLYINADPGFTLTNTTTVPYYSVNTDTLNYYSASTPFYVLGDTPNVQLAYTASTTIEFDGGGGDGIISIYYLRNNVSTILNSQTYSSVPTSPIIIAVSGTFIPTENDELFLNLGSSFFNVGFTASNIQWSITQSVDPVSSSVLTVLEPYLTENFFYSDCNALYGNADGLEYDDGFMRVLYDNGSVIPSNQSEILSNTAERAPVKPYNYALKAQILPRYNGVRSTSLFINKWTGPNSGLFADGTLYPGDSNTYGKSPTVESSNILVAYCDSIEENTPEINGVSYAHIKYLIDQNGQIRIPNISENSLSDVSNTFISNENISLYSSGQNLGEIIDFKPIIRGGQRVETLLYNQNGTNPITWESTITLKDINTSSSLIDDYQAILGITSNFTPSPPASFQEIPFDIIFSSGSGTNNIVTPSPNRLKITSGMINDGVAITFNMSAKVTSPGGAGSAFFELYNFTTGYRSNAVGANLNAYTSATFNLNFTLSPTQLILNDEWGIRMTVGHTYEYLQQSSQGISQLKIIQSPSPDSAISTAGLWQSSSGFPVGEDYYNSNILFTTESKLVNLFNSPTLFQEQIAGSGFNSSSLNWNIIPGDEFRFEGREDRVYMVENVYITSSVPPTNEPGLIINLNGPLISSSIMNVNHFMIRRYIDDPSSILFLGNKPIGSIPPYIIKPQYITELLSKNIDKYITDLTRDGIITS